MRFLFAVSLFDFKIFKLLFQFPKQNRIFNFNFKFKKILDWVLSDSSMETTSSISPWAKNRISEWDKKDKRFFLRQIISFYIHNFILNMAQRIFPFCYKTSLFLQELLIASDSKFVLFSLGRSVLICVKLYLLIKTIFLSPHQVSSCYECRNPFLSVNAFSLC